LADKAYDIDSFRQALTENGTTAVIPSQKNRLNPAVHDRHIYKEMNSVFFSVRATQMTNKTTELALAL